MRVKLGNGEIEVVNFKAMDKGALKGSFALVEYPEGRKTLDCMYFEKGSQSWFSFPSRKISREGQTDNYIPYVSYSNKTYLEELKSAVIESIKGANGQENAHKKQTDQLQDDSSSLWG